MQDTEYEASSGGIPYRIRKSAHNPDDPEKGEFWFFEHRQDPKSPEWAPRGTLYRKDGKFLFMGKEFDSMYEALHFRLSMGP